MISRYFNWFQLLQNLLEFTGKNLSSLTWVNNFTIWTYLEHSIFVSAGKFSRCHWMLVELTMFSSCCMIYLFRFISDIYLFCFSVAFGTQECFCNPPSLSLAPAKWHKFTSSLMVLALFLNFKCVLFVCVLMFTQFL